MDPKLSWALRNLAFFPEELTQASFEELIRVPGIGPIPARKTIQARRFGQLSEDTLKKLRISPKRAKYFITLRGKLLYRANRRIERALSNRQLPFLRTREKKV